MSKGSQSPKSPYIMTRISPKSPYIMAMKSPKSPMLSEKYKSGCAWGLISIFDFRHGRVSKKLISDRRNSNRHSTGDGNIRSRLNILSSVDEKCQCVSDGQHNKTLAIESAKDKDMATGEKVKKSTTGVVEHVQPDHSSAGHLKKHRTQSKPSHVSGNGSKDATILGRRQPSRQISVDELLHKLDSSATTDSLHNRQKHDRDNGFAKKDNDCLEYTKSVQMNDLAEAFVNQKFIDGKILSGSGTSSQSKQFLDALQILNSNKELFLKLLQDPDSLLVKHIEDLRDSQAKQATHEAELQEHEATNAGQPVCTKKIRNENMRDIILKKIKFRESYPPKEAEAPQVSNEIVVLKPGPSSTQNCENSCCSSEQSNYSGTKGQRTRPTSFTLGGIRKKLRHAIGVSRKEQDQLSINDKSYETSSEYLSMEDCGKGIGRKMIGSSPGETDVKRRDKIGRTKSFESSIGHEIASSCESDLKNSLTARHHIESEPNSEMPRNEENGKLQTNNIDSCPSSPRENAEVPSLIGSKKPNGQMQIYNSKPNNMENLLSDGKVPESISFFADSLCSRGSESIVETKDSIRSEETYLLEVPSELNDTCIICGNESNNTANACREDKSLKFLRLDSPPSLEIESVTSSLEISSSALLNIQKVKDVSNTKDGAEQPSPVSVLEEFFIEDVTSPANSLSQSDELPVEPQQISFEEECSARLSFPLDGQRTLSTSWNEHGSLTDYVKSVVQAASLNWEELSLNCDMPDQLLELSLYDEFGVSCSDHGLLFDLINEIFLQVYQYYFRCSPWVSIMKPNIRPFSVEEHVVHEVVKCFDCHLQPELQTLVHLAEKDLAKSVTWMDIRIDVEETVSEMVESVVEELIMETVPQLQV